MKGTNLVQLLLNEDHQDHGQVITKLLSQAQHLECLVAFAKTSALKGVMPELKKALEQGLTARFAIGLSFYLTEPKLLRQFCEISKNYPLKLYLSNSSETFHPKIYAFQSEEQCTAIIGSANLTSGGFSGNYEASTMITDTSGTLMASVTQHFDELIANEIIVLATKPLIDAYEQKYILHDAWRKVAQTHADKLSSASTPSYTLLLNTLELMKKDDSWLGFDEQKTLRRSNRHQAQAMLENLASPQDDVKRNFLEHYDALIRLFHSGGQHRGKTEIAKHPDQFLAAVADIAHQKKLSPLDAFNILHSHFTKIPKAGINLLTEILHTLDNKRFAVMNQNAVSGIRRAGITDYPLRPLKTNISGDLYAKYCQDADITRKALGLADFTELDALFNYAYWGQATGKRRQDAKLN